MNDVKYCQIEVRWTPTRDSRVTNHKIEVYPGGTRNKHLEADFPPSTSSFIFNCPDGTTWHVVSRHQIEDNDGKIIEESVETFDIAVPLLNKPMAATNFDWKMIEISELPQILLPEDFDENDIPEDLFAESEEEEVDKTDGQDN